ncbi:hypothetical protein LIER_28618 [Lithospermum erythrorhizon]|uniref:Retrotransposon gag domain-containing protein n=1 Tax=Lithospermum erythrorhizon TaxID=34254 RepID=A0AAV3RHF7_LITER
MSFSDRLDSSQLRPGFKLRQWNSDSLVAKYGTAVQKRQDERILMDIQQGKNESLRPYHSRYNNLLLNIPMVDDKVAYMEFCKSLHYGKLKKALLIRTPLTKMSSQQRETLQRSFPLKNNGQIQPTNLYIRTLRQHSFKSLCGGSISTDARQITTPNTWADEGMSRKARSISLLRARCPYHPRMDKQPTEKVAIGKGLTSKTFVALFTVVDILDSSYNNLISLTSSPDVEVPNNIGHR